MGRIPIPGLRTASPFLSSLHSKVNFLTQDGGMWFREINVKRQRRGTFANLDSLNKTIMDYIHNHSQNPQAFVLTATAKRIIG